MKKKKDLEKKLGRNSDKLKNANLVKWYEDMLLLMQNPAKYTKYTPEQKDKKLRELKVGKYREWTFSVDRFNEIVQQCSDDITNRSIRNSIDYCRSNYEEAQFMTDEEILESGMYKKMWQDQQSKSKKNKEELRNLANDANFEDMLY